MVPHIEKDLKFACSAIMKGWKKAYLKLDGLDVDERGSVSSVGH